MSLINDALKRVKTAQQQQPPSSSTGPQLKPVEPTPPIRSAVGVLMPVAFALVALLALFLLWELRKKSDLTEPITVRAQASHPENIPAPPEGSSPDSKVAPAAIQSSTGSPEAVSGTPALATSSGSSVPGHPAGTVRSPDYDRSGPRLSESNQSSPVIQTLQSTGQVAAVAGGEAVLATKQTGLLNSDSNNMGTNEVAPPQPPPLKLQGIVYDPKRPSAVINGRTLFVGDRIRQMRVIAITPETATLVDSGHTNVLSLAE